MQRRKSLSDISSLKSHRNAPPADLLACFPPRNPQYSVKRLPAPPSHQQRNSGKSYDDSNDEPTSPKVTCAGQIKVKSKPKSWQAVMHDIERIHMKKPSATHFLSTCLRNFRFDFRCFGSIPEIMSDDDEDEDEEEDRDHSDEYNDPFVVDRGKMMDGGDDARPPPNALLLMRSRSAPLKSWLQEEEKEKEKKNEKERRREAERLVVMRCGDDFSKLSDDIAKETWIGEGTTDILATSRSWKR